MDDSWPTQGDFARLRETGEEGRITHVFSVYPFRGEVVLMVDGKRRRAKLTEIEPVIKRIKLR